MFVSVSGGHHKVKVTCVSVVLKLGNAAVPGFEGVVFLHVIEVVENSETRWEIGSLKTVLNKVVEVRLAPVVQTGAKAPGKTPSENSVEILAFLLVVSFESCLNTEEIIKEVAN